MVNEEKVRLMAKAASFEAGEGKKALAMNRFFRGDYISLGLIGAWLSYTVAFALCFALWALYKMEYLMENIHKMDLPAFGRGLALLYISLLGIFLILNYVVYHDRYQKNRKALAIYNHLLKQIAHIYQKEGGSGTAEKGAKDDENLTGV